MIGAIIVVVGLYLVIWGKAKDDDSIIPAEPSADNRNMENFDQELGTTHMNNCRGAANKEQKHGNDSSTMV